MLTVSPTENTRSTVIIVFPREALKRRQNIGRRCLDIDRENRIAIIGSVLAQFYYENPQHWEIKKSFYHDCCNHVIRFLDLLECWGGWIVAEKVELNNFDLVELKFQHVIDIPTVRKHPTVGKVIHDESGAVLDDRQEIVLVLIDTSITS